MADRKELLDRLCAEIDAVFAENDVLSGIGTFDQEEIMAAVKAKGEQTDSPCVCGAHVMCNNAIEGAAVHMVKDGNRVEFSGLEELNKKDILMDIPFAGCEAVEDKICRVKPEYIEDGEWQDVDKTRNQGKDKETLKYQSSYMVCTKGWGIIYFKNAGQVAKNYADKMAAFLDNLQEQFGFDERTVGILGQIYREIHEKYEDRDERDRDWMFARALSQMAGYNNKRATLEIGGIEIFGMETHAWRRGAGWVFEYKYECEKEFFCDTLGIDEADYKYMRFWVRLQHLITSNYEGEYTYDAVCKLKEKDEEEFQGWKANMEQGLDRTLSDGEYLRLFKQAYDTVNQKGDFSHMLYTIAANLKDEGHGVENEWDNSLAPETSWSSADERKDVAGWLGDAVYDGDDGKISFGEDDYIADLDADNIAHFAAGGQSLVDAANEYYSGLKENGEEYRTELFVKNNTYEKVESDILKRLKLWDVNEDGTIDYKDLSQSKIHVDTYNFLVRLKEYQ